MMLNRRQQIANKIPSSASVSAIMTIGKTIERTSFIGVPSKGIPSVRQL